MVLSSAQGFADMLGDDFDLIGFDPRGELCRICFTSEASDVDLTNLQALA